MLLVSSFVSLELQWKEKEQKSIDRGREGKRREKMKNDCLFFVSACLHNVNMSLNLPGGACLSIVKETSLSISSSLNPSWTKIFCSKTKTDRSNRTHWQMKSMEIFRSRREELTDWVCVNDAQFEGLKSYWDQIELGLKRRCWSMIFPHCSISSHRQRMRKWSEKPLNDWWTTDVMERKRGRERHWHEKLISSLWRGSHVDIVIASKFTFKKKPRKETENLPISKNAEIDQCQNNSRHEIYSNIQFIRK